MDKLLKPKDRATCQRQLAERAARIAALSAVFADQHAAAAAARGRKFQMVNLD